MIRQSTVLSAFALALAGTAGVGPVPAGAQPGNTQAALEAQFLDPPNSARPRVWWHWLNGNVTKDGIVKDLDWMQRIGIGGLQNFDVDLGTPVMVPRRLAYMTPEWKDAFRFAASEAEKRGLEFAIAASPGWSETGGPWVEPKDALKKVVWSETLLTGGKRFTGKLAPLPLVTGPFQDLPLFDPVARLTGAPQHEPPRFGGDIRVLAVPVVAAPLPQPRAYDASLKPIDPALFGDASLASALMLPHGSAAAPTSVTLDYGTPVTVRSASMFALGAKGMFSGAAFAPVLESSRDGKNWTQVGAMPVEEVPTTIGFAAVTARWFRVTFAPLSVSGSNMGNAAPGIVPPPFVTMMAGGANAPISLNDLRLSGEVRVDRFEAKAGFDIERDYYALPTPTDNGITDASNKVIDLTDRMRSDGTLDWTPPKGRWKVIRLGFSLLGTTNHPAPAEATGLEVDKFDGEAVRGYLDHYLGMYKDATGTDLFGARGVRALLTDSIEVGAANWTPKMIEQFKRLRGYDPTLWLPALTGVVMASREASDRFLYDYRRTLADLMASEHYGTVADVAHKNGLKVYGEALEDHRPSLGDDMEMRRYADVPMAALWTFPQGGKPNPSYLADMKGAASVAHLYGQNLVAAESMTSALSYWADSPRTLKHAIDLEFVSGINRPVIHTSVHSPDEAGEPGLSLMIFGQYFNRHEGWAELAKPWIDYIARNSFMLQQGRNHADVAYFYGEEAPLTGLYGDTPVADAPKTYAYDFVSAGALMEALHTEGDELVSIGGARYKVLYLGGSSSRMTVSMLKRLTALVEGGATVVGLAPKDSPSLDDPMEWTALVARLWRGGVVTRIGKGRVIASADIESALDKTLGLPSDLRFTGGQSDTDLPFVHRKLDDGDSYFIVNRKNRAESVEAHFRVTGKIPQLWHADTGKITAADFRVQGQETVVNLRLDAEESVHVVFRELIPNGPYGTLVGWRAPSLDLPLGGPWTVTFQPGRGAPDAITMAQLAPLDQSTVPGVKYFSGIATYSCSFTLPKRWKTSQSLQIDLGDVREVAEVRLNGQLVGYVWHAPYQLDLSAAAKAGANTLEIRVGTLWVNRLIGDAQPGAKPLTRTALQTYAANAPLQPSGLIGPVRLLGY